MTAVARRLAAPDVAIVVKKRQIVHVKILHHCDLCMDHRLKLGVAELVDEFLCQSRIAAFINGS